MPKEEAIRLAEECAQRLKIPWNSVEVTAQRRHWRPFPAFWKITFATRMDDISAIAIFHVKESDAQARPIKLRYVKTLAD